MDRPFADQFSAASTGACEDESRARKSLFVMARMRTPRLPDPVEVRIRNLSAGGLMAEFATPLDRDTPVEVDVRGIGWIAGRIAWFAEGRAGVAFLEPVDPQLAC